MKRNSHSQFALSLGILLLSIPCFTSCLSFRPNPNLRSDSNSNDNRAIQTAAEAQAHFAAGVVHEVNEESAAACDEFFQAANLNPRDADLLNEVANRLIEARQFDRAIEVLKRTAKLPEADEMTFVRLGYVYSQLGNNAKSIEANAEAIRRQPKMLALRQNLYLNHLSANDPEAALTVLNEASTESLADADFLVNLAELYANLAKQFPGQRLAARSKALEVLNRASTNAPLALPIQLKLGDGFNLLGDKNSAAKIYLEVLGNASATSPLHEILRSKLIEIFMRGGDHDRAAEQLKTILLQNPTNATALYFLGSIDFEQKKWDSAASNFRRVIGVNPAFEQAHYDLASALVALGKGDEAKATLDEARKQFAGSFPLEFLTGLALCEQKQHELALAYFSAAEKIGLAGETNRLNAGFYFQFGAASERAGHYPDAAKYFERSIALAPDNAEAMNYLGYMWADRGENLPRAKILIEAALKIEPDNDAFLDSMGWVLFKMGDFQAATDYLLKAISKLEKPDSTVYDHLGDAHAATNALDKAREAWAKSLSIEPNDVVQKKLDAALKELSR